MSGCALGGTELQGRPRVRRGEGACDNLPHSSPGSLRRPSLCPPQSHESEAREVGLGVSGSRGGSPCGRLGPSRKRHRAPVPTPARTRREGLTPSPSARGKHARLWCFCHLHGAKTATHRQGRWPSVRGPASPAPPRTSGMRRLSSQPATRPRPEAMCPQAHGARSPWSAVQSGRRRSKVPTARIRQKGLLRG